MPQKGPQERHQGLSPPGKLTCLGKQALLQKKSCDVRFMLPHLGPYLTREGLVADSAGCPAVWLCVRALSLPPWGNKPPGHHCWPGTKLCGQQQHQSAGSLRLAFQTRYGHNFHQASNKHTKKTGTSSAGLRQAGLPSCVQEFMIILVILCRAIRNQAARRKRCCKRPIYLHAPGGNHPYCLP